MKKVAYTLVVSKVAQKQSLHGSLVVRHSLSCHLQILRDHLDKMLVSVIHNVLDTI